MIFCVMSCLVSFVFFIYVLSFFFRVCLSWCVFLFSIFSFGFSVNISMFFLYIWILLACLIHFCTSVYILWGWIFFLYIFFYFLTQKFLACYVLFTVRRKQVVWDHKTHGYKLLLELSVIYIFFTILLFTLFVWRFSIFFIFLLYL